MVPMESFEIIIPHKRTFINDKALQLTLDTINKNSVLPHPVKILEDPPNGRIDPYLAWNKAVDESDSDFFVMLNSDTPVAPNWDAKLNWFADEETILFGVLVECGVIGVNSKNIHKSYGSCPICFRRDSFESWTRPIFEGYADNYRPKAERGWIVPSLIPKALFIKMGRFPVDKPFMYAPNDEKFLDVCEANKVKFLRIPWFMAYHFQNLSARKSRCSCYEKNTSENPAGY
jgi:hypothetical protein